jgi:hypothetical protein
MVSRFQDVARTVEALEAAARRVNRFKTNPSISSYATSVSVQVTAMLGLFRRMKVNKLVTAKVGSWRKRLILADVLINYADAQTRPRTGEEAFELAKLMERAMAAVRTIIETALPGVTGFCPTHGVVDGYYRFQ